MPWKIEIPREDILHFSGLSLGKQRTLKDCDVNVGDDVEVGDNVV